jgi:hypothetical protein
MSRISQFGQRLRSRPQDQVLLAAGLLRGRCGEPFLLRCSQCGEAMEASAWQVSGGCPLCGETKVKACLCARCGGEFNPPPPTVSDRHCLSIPRFSETGIAPFEPNEIVLGSANHGAVCLSPDLLCGHILVAGASGNHEKTHALAALASAVMRSRIPVIALVADGELERRLETQDGDRLFLSIVNRMFPARDYFAFIEQVMDEIVQAMPRLQNTPRALLIIDYADVLFREGKGRPRFNLDDLLARMSAEGVAVAFSDDTADGVSKPLMDLCDLRIFLPMITYVSGEEKRIRALARRIDPLNTTALSKALRGLSLREGLLSRKAGEVVHPPLLFTLELLPGKACLGHHQFATFETWGASMKLTDIFKSFGKAGDKLDGSKLLAAFTSGDDATLKALFSETDVNGLATIDERESWAPLHYACRNFEDADAVEKLVSLCGADVNLADGEGKTPLYWATLNPNKETAQKLITFLLAKGVAIDAMANDGKTALCGAAFAIVRSTSDVPVEELAVAELLLKNGANPNLPPAGSPPPLFIAMVEFTDESITKSSALAGLLIQYGADVNMCWNGDVRPIFAAIETGNSVGVELLVESGCDLAVTGGPDNMGLVDFAFMHEQGDIAMYLNDRMSEFVFPDDVEEDAESEAYREYAFIFEGANGAQLNEIESWFRNMFDDVEYEPYQEGETFTIFFRTPKRFVPPTLSETSSGDRLCDLPPGDTGITGAILGKGNFLGGLAIGLDFNGRSAADVTCYFIDDQRNKWIAGLHKYGSLWPVEMVNPEGIHIDREGDVASESAASSDSSEAAEVSETATAGLTCAACGEVNSVEAKFCTACGNRLGGHPQSPADAYPDAPSEIEPELQAENPVAEATLSKAEKLRFDYWTQLLALANQKTSLHASVKPSTRYYVQRSMSNGYLLKYACNAQTSQVELFIDVNSGAERELKNKEAFHKLMQDREAIEAKFGGSLDWDELPIACRICAPIDGGTKSPHEHWPAIHAAMVDAMMRLFRALPSDIVGSEK